MNVIILAGGLGTRLRSVVSEAPKCMAEVAGKPFLYYLLKYLEKFTIHHSPFTIEKVVLSVGYLRKVIFEWLAENGKDFPFKFDFAVEETPLGTGGGIRLALQKTSSDKVLILNGDTFFDVDLGKFIDFAEHSNAKINIALKQMKNFDRYGTVTLSKNSIIQSFNEKQHCTEGLINGGVYLIDKTKCDLSAMPEKFSFETDVLQREVQSGTLAGFVDSGYFIDIGIPEDYGKANLQFTIHNSQFNTLFLDRDGVINRLRPNDYVKTWEEFEFLPDILEKLAEWAMQFKHIIVVTNQRGVGKGLMTENDLQEIHRKMISEIEKHGGRIDKIYYCIALTDENPNRKPNTGMALQAKRDFSDIDFSKSLMIGDSESDMKFAENLRMKGVRI